MQDLTQSEIKENQYSYIIANRMEKINMEIKITNHKPENFTFETAI